MTEQCRLKKDITAEGHTIKAGTVVDIEQTYPTTDEGKGFVDLFDPATETLFWAYETDIERIAQ